MAEPAFALEPPAMAALRDQLSSCLAELRTAKGAVNQFVRVCVQRGLPVDRSLTASLHTAAQQAEHRVERELRVAAVSDLSGMLSAGESVVRFALSTAAYVRGALEWCAQSYDQSRAVQFFDAGALDSPVVNYERYSHRAVERVEAQLASVFGLNPERSGLCVTSSGMAAFAVLESFLIRERLRPGDVVLTAPYIYFETAEQLAALPHVRLEKTGGYAVPAIMADVLRLRPRALFVDPVANTGPQRMVDLDRLLHELRKTITWRMTVVIDGTMAAAALPAALLESCPLVEVLYYESGSKYLQLGLDCGMAGVLVFPAALTDRIRHLRRNAGGVLYRHSAELFPRYSRADLRARMLRICGNAADLAALLHADPRVLAAGAVHHPLLPDHPDHAVAGRLPYVTGFANFLHGEPDRNTRPGLTPMIDRVLAHARDLGVQVTKGASFGFSVPRASPADPMGEGEPTFLRLYAGDRDDQVPALAEAVGRALAEYPAPR